MSRERKPSGLPDERIGKSYPGGFDSYMDVPVGIRPEGVRRVRNVFALIALLLAVMVLVVLVAGDSDAAIGIAMALLAPTAIFTAISQFVLWYAEERN